MSAHDLLPGSTYTLHEVELDYVPMFYTSSVHFDWIMAQEKHVLGDVVETIRGGECGTVIDVGMNDGFYTMLFAALGCEVYSFEVQPRCIEVALGVALKNNLTHRINVFESPVTAKDGEYVGVSMGAQSTGSCDGGFSIHANNPGEAAHIPFEKIGERRLRGTQLDNMFLGLMDEITYVKVMLRVTS